MCGALGWIQREGNALACARPLTLMAMESMIIISIVK